jgi:DNA-binding NarL/FixJ family response regulator
MRASMLMGQPHDDLSCSVLMCDDNQEIRDVIRTALIRDPRFRVVGEAADGATCLAQVRHVQPDVLILDVNMPGGGPEVARAARQVCPAMQILVFSGATDGGCQERMLDAGADEFIMKTGRTRHLLDGLARAAKRKRLPQ